jgi:hypothetical protein
MSRAPQTWFVQRSAPVRADAEGLFVPADDVPDAAIGDIVVVQGHAGGESRTGTIVETSEHDRQRFFRLELEQ